jgi:hypothetical protein
MAARREGSLAWLVIAGVISLGVAGALWGLMDSTFVAQITAQSAWSAPDGSIEQLGRQYVLTTWNWLLLVVVLRLGLEAIVASRLTGGSTTLVVGTFVLVIVHLVLVMLTLIFPEMATPVYEQAEQTGAIQGTDFMRAATLAYQWAIGPIPAVLLLIADGWYLSSPIRRDALGV